LLKDRFTSIRLQNWNRENRFKLFVIFDSFFS